MHDIMMVDVLIILCDLEFLRYDWDLIHIEILANLDIWILFVIKPILMHDPVCLLAMRCPSYVKDQSFSHANSLWTVEVNGFVPSRSFPKSSRCGPICPGPGRIFLVLVAKKVPFVLRARSNSTFVYRDNRDACSKLRCSIWICSWLHRTNLKYFLF